MKKSNLSKADLRRQAEAKLSEYRKKTGPLPETEADTRRLVHELQVHQIELEMQNEELAQSRAEVESLLKQFTDLYDFAPVGYFTLARDGTISKANLVGATLLGAGAGRGKLIKRRIGLFIAPESRYNFNAFLEKAFIERGKKTCEIALLKTKDKTTWIHIEGIRSEDGEECRIATVDISKRVLAEEKLKYLNAHDALTGLYNRRFFIDEMERLERGRNFPISIAMADVDRLKDINDHYGHTAGDALLKRVAQMLTVAFRAEDVVARIGGDEFAVLLPATSSVEAEETLKRMRQAIEQENNDHSEIPICLSFGVNTARNPMSLADVLKEADANMYREKRGNDVS